MFGCAVFDVEASKRSLEIWSRCFSSFVAKLYSAASKTCFLIALQGWRSANRKRLVPGTDSKRNKNRHAWDRSFLGRSSHILLGASVSLLHLVCNKTQKRRFKQMLYWLRSSFDMRLAQGKSESLSAMSSQIFKTKWNENIWVRGLRCRNCEILPGASISLLLSRVSSLQCRFKPRLS